ncbi:uncharacterized protein [Diadema setosum]|uniref:uncharacterized protein n=1 Tax=Diadema setosum TaxID=31175 RepID=UPI003B3BE7A1
MDTRAGHHLIRPVGDGHPVYLWRKGNNKTTTAKSKDRMSSDQRKRSQMRKKGLGQGKKKNRNVSETREEDPVTAEISAMAEEQRKRDGFYHALGSGLYGNEDWWESCSEDELGVTDRDSSVVCKDAGGRPTSSRQHLQRTRDGMVPASRKGQGTRRPGGVGREEGVGLDDSRGGRQGTRGAGEGERGVRSGWIPTGKQGICQQRNSLITEYIIDEDDEFAYDDASDTTKQDPNRNEQLYGIGKHLTASPVSAATENNGIQDSDMVQSKAGSRVQSISAPAKYTAPHKNTFRTKNLPERSESSIDDSDGASTSSRHDSDGQVEMNMSRPHSARAAVERQHRERKEAALEDMRVHLHRRVRQRREKSVIGDDIFQRQLKSGFWTSEVLYHQWGNSILKMRSTWKGNESQEFRRSSTDAGEEPRRLRARRQAISVERDRRSPLTMATMSFVPTTDATDPDTSNMDLEQSIRAFNSRRRSSGRPSQPKDRSYSMDYDGQPIRLDVQEDSITRRNRLRQLFRETIVKVVRITRVMLRMIEQSKASTYSGLMASLHFSAVDGSDDPKNFNKEQYSRKFANLHVPLWAKRVVCKDPWERTPEEIVRLYGVMRNMRSFEKFTRRMRMEICRSARYNQCGKGRVIVRQGHIGYNFYFIFSGSVFVQLDVIDESSGVTTTTNVNTLGRGACFGELALLGSGKRTASIICRETTEFFEIEKETFLEVCPDIFDNELAEKIQVASDLQFFRQWPESDLRRLCFESPIQEIDFGKVVETDPGSSEYCYVVLKGKVTVLKECDIAAALVEHRRDVTRRSAGDGENKTLSLTGLDESRLADELRNLMVPEWTRNGRCFMRIGLMSIGHATDILPIKFRDREQLKNLTLVSRGCRLMRVSKMRVEKLAPREVLEQFRLKHDTTMPIPSNEELFERFLADTAWRHFRSYANRLSHVTRLVDQSPAGESAGLSRYLATSSLLKEKRRSLAEKERMREIMEKHRKRTQVHEEEDHDDDEEEEESEQDQHRKIYLTKLKKGTLPSSFSRIEDTFVL